MKLESGRFVQNSEPLKATKTTILSVQVMRGLAAVAVAIYHTHLVLAQPEFGGVAALGSSVLGSVASRGWLGVNFFFVLSGFIIMFAHVDDVGKPDRLGNYLWKRFSRVYPVYWVFLTLFLVAAYKGIGHPNFSWSTPNILSAYALVELAEPLSLPLQVAWTLFYEVTFYAVFAVLVLNRTAGIVMLAGWMISILVCGLVFGYEPGRLQMWSDMWGAYFLVGMCVYFLFRNLDGRWAMPILACGLLLLLVMGWKVASGRVSITQKNPLALLMLAFPFALILLGGALGEQRYKWHPPKFLLNIGDATYSIYLVHSSVISIIALVIARLGAGMLPPLVLFAIMAAASVSAGVLAHMYVEKPVLRALRGLRSARRIPRTAAE